MGNYNSYYESYYNRLLNKSGNDGAYNSSNKIDYRKRHYKTDEDNPFVKLIIRQLTGVLILFLFVLICRLVVTPRTAAAYKFCENMINKEYDYKEIVLKVKNLKVQDFQEKIVYGIEKIRCGITGDKTFKESINENFILPIQGKIISCYGDEKILTNNKKAINEGIDIAVSEEGIIKAAFEGIVKKCDENKELGKYVLIDHGDGIETIYSNLSEIRVKEKQEISKSQIVGLCENSNYDMNSYMHFELLYMGENKDPAKYMCINN